MVHVVAAWLLVPGALVGLSGVVVPLFFKDADTGEYDRWPALWPALFTAVWLTLVWRIMRTGIYFGDGGVRIRTLARTVTYPWPEIVMAEARDDHLWLRLTGDRELKTPVRRLAGAQTGRRGGIALDPAEFNIVLNRIRGLRPGC